MKNPERKGERFIPQPALEEIQLAIRGDSFWQPYLAKLTNNAPLTFSLHLAVFVEPFLGYVLEGAKTVESRFSSVRCAPYGKVRSGDVLLLKQTGGPVVGLCRITQSWSYQLDPDSWQGIREKFAEAMCAQNPDFWESRRHASYATLMTLDHVLTIDPVEWKKTDRRGWVVVRSKEEPSLFGDNHEVRRTELPDGASE